MTTTADLLTQAAGLLGQLLMDGGALTEESEALIDTWLEGSTDKIGGCRACRLQLQSQIELLRDEERRIASRRKSLERHKVYIEGRALALLQMRADFGEEAKVKTDAYTAWVQTSPAVATDPDTFDLAKVPDAYLTEQAPRLNKTEALKALKTGKEIPGLVLEWREKARFA